jgi:hypothetical protein
MTVSLTLSPSLRDIVSKLGAPPAVVASAPAPRRAIGSLVPPAATVGIRVFVKEPAPAPKMPTVLPV